MNNHTVYGSKFEQTRGLNLKAVAKLLRKDLREAQQKGYLPSSLKFSVRCRFYSGGQSLDVTIKGYDRPILNELHYREPHKTHNYLTPMAASIKRFVEGLRRAYNYDDSDSMTDYFDCRYYGTTDFCHNQMNAEMRRFLG